MKFSAVTFLVARNWAGELVRLNPKITACHVSVAELILQMRY